MQEKILRNIGKCGFNENFNLKNEDRHFLAVKASALLKHFECMEEKIRETF